MNQPRKGNAAPLKSALRRVAKRRHSLAPHVGAGIRTKTESSPFRDGTALVGTLALPLQCPEREAKRRQNAVGKKQTLNQPRRGRSKILRVKPRRPYLTTKFLLLVSVPPGKVTTTGPVLAPRRTTATIYVSDITLKLVAETPMKVTAVVP